MRTNTRLLAGLMGALISAAAFADCIDGMRDATAGETQYQKRVSAALKEALPAPPANWKLGPVRESGIGGFCKGDREGDFEINISASYTYTPPKEEGDRLYTEYRKLQSEIDALAQLPPDIAKERQGWLDKMSEANRASNKAYKEGNKELARQKDAEAEDYSRKGRAVRDKYMAGIQQQSDQLSARQKLLEYRGSAVNVTLVANERNPKSPDPKTGAEIVVGKTPTPKAPGLKVHNVRVVLEGAAAKREQIQSAIDKEKLARIMQ
jgi:hypothetical protein